MWHEVLLWGIFTLFVLAMLALDLGVFHRKGHVIHIREALAWSAVWIALSLLFTGIRMGLQRNKEIDPEKNPVLRLFHRFMPVTEDYADGKFFVKRSGRR